MRQFFKSKNALSWTIVTAIVLVVAIVVNILATGILFELINSFFKGNTAEFVGENTSQYQADEGIATKADAKAYGDAVTLQACEEGFVLLKNNGALPLQSDETRVSVFGKNSVNMAFGGSGSGGAVGITPKTIFDSLTAVGIEYNQALVDFYNDNSRSGAGRDKNNSDLDSGSNVALTESFVGETPVSSYDDALWDSCEDYKDAAFIVITRIGGEGADLPRTENDHVLKLRPDEKDLIAAVKGHGFEKIILVLNTASAMELKDVAEDDQVDGILWIGYTGEAGMMAFGEVVTGAVNPSGRTVDTYAADFTKDPTWNNFGAALGSPTAGITGDAYFSTAGRGMVDSNVYFVDYEESVYVGYRYYETAYAEAQAGNYPGFDYDEAVVYPFGYGLSYSEFSWELVNASEIPATLDKDTSITFQIEVSNLSDTPGKDVVQLYVTPPYTPGGIEKPAKILVGFAKTPVITKGEPQIVEITVDSPYAFASYDCYGLSGTQGYIAEKGDYTFTISTDAHNAKDMENATVTASIASDIIYDTDPTTGYEVKNLYTGNEDETLDSDWQLQSQLSRSDFAGTWPQVRPAEDKQIDDDTTYTEDFISAMTSTEPNPNRPAQEDTMPVTGVDSGIMLSDLVGVAYDDEEGLWDKFMDQLTVGQMTDLINKGAFHTEMIAQYGVPSTLSSDGPAGWVNFMPGYAESFGGCTTYCCQVVFSSTWNEDCLAAMGNAIGNEGIIGNTERGGLPYSSWYSPGLNIHRSPFGGRNFEYYSEDPFLSGKMTAAVVKAAADKGVYCHIKHFALNEQETHRASNGVLTFATEQAMREIYLKSFEIAIKDCIAYGQENNHIMPMGVMSSFNRIGTRWAGGDYRLITEILRNEWGFTGSVICDFNTCNHMVEKDMFYAGGDLNLQFAGQMVWNPDAGNASDVTVLRSAAKNVLFTVANSNAMRGEFRAIMPTWMVVMIAVDVLLGVGLAVWGFFAVRSGLEKCKEAPGASKQRLRRERNG